jgi:hypothetical protein
MIACALIGGNPREIALIRVANRKREFALDIELSM